MMKHSLFLFVFALWGCALGTGTGNPFSTSGAGDPASGGGNQTGAGSVSGYVFVQVCKAVERCNPGMTDQDCGTGIMNLTGFAPKLGLTTSPPPTVEQIVTMEFSHQLIADPVAGDKCVAQMLKLQCSDPVMQNAYVPGAEVPFAGTPDILDPVCAGVFAQ
jgi:hypothetical protein